MKHKSQPILEPNGIAAAVSMNLSATAADLITVRTALPRGFQCERNHWHDRGIHTRPKVFTTLRMSSLHGLMNVLALQVENRQPKVVVRFSFFQQEVIPPPGCMPLRQMLLGQCSLGQCSSDTQANCHFGKKKNRQGGETWQKS